MQNAPNLLNLMDLRFEPGWQAPLHAHADHCELLLVTEGRIALRAGAMAAIGRPGSLFCYGPRREHAEWTEGNRPVRLFCLTWRDAANTSSREETAGGIWSGEDQQGRLLFLLRWMTELFPARSEAERATLDALLQAALHESARTAATPESASLQSAQNFALANLAAPLDLDTLAGVACLSRFHFARAFKRDFGFSPMVYVRRARVEAARSLLVNTPLSLGEVAVRVGLGDACHLARVIRRMTGCSPQTLRRKGKKI